MNTPKYDTQLLLDNLPDDCTLEDIQYHLYVLEKIKRSQERAETEGTISHEDVKKRLAKSTGLTKSRF